LHHPPSFPTRRSSDLAYHVYSTGNQDTPNPLAQDPASTVNLVHPFVRDSAEFQSGSTTLRDKRFLAKVTTRGTDFSLNCLTSGLDRKSTRLNSSHVAI